MIKIRAIGKILILTMLVNSPIILSAKPAQLWEPNIFKEPDIRDDETESVNDFMMKKYMARYRSKISQGISSKLEGESTIVDVDEGRSSFGPLKSQIDSKYPGLFQIGTLPASPHIVAYDDITNKYATKFGVDPNLMRALMSQESYGGAPTNPGRAAWGPAQIEYTLGGWKSGPPRFTDPTGGEFGKFGREYFGRTFNTTRVVGTDDRGNVEYNIAFGCFRFSETLEHYQGDYVKALQAYNFSHYSLDKLLIAYPNGNEWLSKRGDMALHNGVFLNEGKRSYGDKTYVEKVLAYYQQ